MLETCEEQHIPLPKFEELDNFFRVTLYPKSTKSIRPASWQKPIFDYLEKHGKINAKTAQEIWQVTRRTTTTRLKEMCHRGIACRHIDKPKRPSKSICFIETWKIT